MIHERTFNATLLRQRYVTRDDFNATLLATLEPRFLLDTYGGQWVKKTAAENHSDKIIKTSKALMLVHVSFVLSNPMPSAFTEHDR